MPFKVNADRRHHIPRQQDRVTNWSEYDAGLRQRGSLTVWFSEEAIAAWRAEPRTTRGGQPHYSALAITTALTLRALFRLALRQTEGLIGSIIRLPPVGAILKHPARLCRPGRQARRAQPRGKLGFPPLDSSSGKETDTPLEGAGFEPSVPLANQHPNCQVGLARYRRTGTG